MIKKITIESGKAFPIFRTVSLFSFLKMILPVLRATENEKLWKIIGEGGTFELGDGKVTIELSEEK